MSLQWSILLSFFNAVWCMNSQFPAGFKFGAATAAHQVEGAWNVSDKSRSIWDEVIHTRPEKVLGRATGDVACDSYHLWRRDVEMASELGLHFYRFSISWPRLLPSGFSNHISEDGMRFYNGLIDELLKNNIEPMVTLYHFDLPQSLQNLGGWTNPYVSDWFADYARVAFELFGDRVKSWITLNEPLILCEYVYNTGASAPAVKSPGVGDYLCSKHVLISHAKAWRIYDKDFRSKYKGRISIINQMIWYEPAKDGEEDAAHLITAYGTGMYSHPIYSMEGGWPKSIETLIAEKSKKEGYAMSRLPAFTQEEKELVRGTFDYFGLNYYTSRQVETAKEGEDIGEWPLTGAPDLNINLKINPEWHTNNFWFSVVPHGIRNVLKWVKAEYGDIEVFIGENGYLSTRTDLDDQDRVDYYKTHLQQVLLAIHEDGVNVTGYTAWSLMDNFEWMDGYHSNFGLYAVDFKDPQRKRTPRSSAFYYTHVIRTNSLEVPQNYTPHPRTTGGAGDIRTLYSTVLLFLNIAAICINRL